MQGEEILAQAVTGRLGERLCLSVAARELVEVDLDPPRAGRSAASGRQFDPIVMEELIGVAGWELPEMSSVGLPPPKTRDDRSLRALAAVARPDPLPPPLANRGPGCGLGYPFANRRGEPAMSWLSWTSDPQAWIALATLIALEIVLGVDNIVFISIVSSKLPLRQRPRARTIGLALAMGMRVALLLTLSWIIRLTQPLFTVLGNEISGRDLILIVGGLFLLGKATHEIHQRLEGDSGHKSARLAPSMRAVLVQIVLLDAVFSLDSVITAVGMVNEIPVMIIAVVVAVIFMMFFAGPLSRFVEAHPTVKMLALSFLLLIGMALVADGLEHHIPKGYIYFAMGFSVFVEMLNLRMRKVMKRKAKPVTLREPYVKDES